MESGRENNGVKRHIIFSHKLVQGHLRKRRKKEKERKRRRMRKRKGKGREVEGKKKKTLSGFFHHFSHSSVYSLVMETYPRGASYQT